MSSFNAQTLLAEVSPDDPCGPDMEYEPVFQEMERAAEGKAEQVMGDSVVEAEGPDWRTVKKNAVEVLGKSKDIRAAVLLAHAAAATEGWAAFCEGLQLVQGLIEQHWDGFHPALDPEDDNDPTMRVNILGGLANADTTLHTLNRTPFVEAKGVGAYGLRDSDIADGSVSLPSNFEGEPPTTAVIEAAFMQVELEELQATAQAVSDTQEAVTGINTGLAAHIPLTETPDLIPLSKVLDQVMAQLNAALERRGVVTEGSAEAADGEEGQAGQGAGISGTVQSAADVVRVLDQISEFYRRTEPSSPVPIMLQRVRKLVDMDFLEIVRELAPSGIGEAEALKGREES